MPLSVQNHAGRRLLDLIREQRRLVAVIAVAELLAIIMVSAINPHDHIDGEVYQLGARAWLDGRDVYGPLPPTESGLRLPFIYPPFAAIAFTPLGVLPKSAAIPVIMVVSHLALMATLYVVLRASAILPARREKVMLVTAAVLPLATITEPVLETITYAQINILLMALVAVDCLWRVDGTRKPPWPRGLLVGLATGLKLTPAAFLLFFLLRRDHRSIVTAVVTFLGTVVVGLVLAFDDSRRFWLNEMLASSDVSFGQGFVGDASTYAGNQSLRSLLSKLQLPEPWLTAAWGLLAIAALTLAVAGMLHTLRRHDLPLALTVNGVLALLVSPISWSHHWVWAVPALVLLIGGAIGRRNWALLVAAVLVAEFFVLGPHWTVPQGDGKELRWNFFEHLLGNAYVYFGAALLIHTALGWRQGHRATATSRTRPAPERSAAHP